MKFHIYNLLVQLNEMKHVINLKRNIFVSAPLSIFESLANRVLPDCTNTLVHSSLSLHKINYKEDTEK